MSSFRLTLFKINDGEIEDSEDLKDLDLHHLRVVEGMVKKQIEVHLKQKEYKQLLILGKPVVDWGELMKRAREAEIEIPYKGGLN